jgi:hypothetical protein
VGVDVSEDDSEFDKENDDVDVSDKVPEKVMVCDVELDIEALIVNESVLVDVDVPDDEDESERL